MTAQPVVRENPAEHRFEIWVGDDMAGQTVYQHHHSEIRNGPEDQDRGSAVLGFVHTEIADRFGGQGLGSTLIRSALETVRARGDQVRPFCPFVRDFMIKNPEYRDLVPASELTRFGLVASVDA
jgi:predicted GNAT family acetyltransferase